MIVWFRIATCIKYFYNYFIIIIHGILYVKKRLFKSSFIKNYLVILFIQYICIFASNIITKNESISSGFCGILAFCAGTSLRSTYLVNWLVVQTFACADKSIA